MMTVEISFKAIIREEHYDDIRRGLDKLPAFVAEDFPELGDYYGAKIEQVGNKEAMKHVR